MATPTTIKDPVLQEHTRIVRILESNLKVKTDDPTELRFRGSLLRKISEDLPNMNPSLVTRCYEAVCEVEFPKDEILAFRKTLQAAIGRLLTLKNYAAPKP
jgi:hypothetical protein